VCRGRYWPARSGRHGAACKRLFLDQSDARVFFITFAVFIRVDLGAIFFFLIAP
jgi:hypothetical protein